MSDNNAKMFIVTLDIDTEWIVAEEVRVNYDGSLLIWGKDYRSPEIIFAPGTWKNCRLTFDDGSDDDE